MSLSPNPLTGPKALSPSVEIEQMATVLEIAAKWHLDASTVRELFGREPGVLAITNPRRRKRRYTTLRIPYSIVARVQRRLSVVDKEA